MNKNSQLTATQRTVLEMLILLAISITILLACAILGVSPGNIFYVGAWLSGLVLLWAILSLIDYALALRGHGFRSSPKGRRALPPKPDHEPTLKVTIPVVAPHPHTLIGRELENRKHGRRSAK